MEIIPLHNRPFCGLIHDTFLSMIICSLVVGLVGALVAKRTREYTLFGRWAWGIIVLYILIISMIYIYDGNYS